MNLDINKVKISVTVPIKNIEEVRNAIYMYIFVTPVYFHEMSESAKTFFDRLKRCDAFNEKSKIKGKKIICIACAGGSGSGTEETLKAFDTLSYFLKTEMIGRIPITKFNFEEQKEKILEVIKK